MINGFVTSDGSVYYVNQYSKVISGGIFKDRLGYSCLQCVIGLPGVIKIPDGSVYKTGVVIEYI